MRHTVLTSCLLRGAIQSLATFSGLAWCQWTHRLSTQWQLKDVHHNLKENGTLFDDSVPMNSNCLLWFTLTGIQNRKKKQSGFTDHFLFAFKSGSIFPHNFCKYKHLTLAKNKCFEIKGPHLTHNIVFNRTTCQQNFHPFFPDSEWTTIHQFTSPLGT